MTERGERRSGGEREVPRADPGAVWRVIHGYTGYWSTVAGVRLGRGLVVDYPERYLSRHYGHGRERGNSAE